MPMTSRTRLVTGAAVAAALGTGLFALRPSPTDAACCYFAAQEKDINQPGQKVFITWDPGQKVESWTVQPKFEGNAVDFGMVIPTPSRPKLDEMPRDFFKDLAIYTILMPLPQGIWPSLIARPMDELKRGGPFPPNAAGRSRETLGEDRGVTVLEAGVVGSLDYKVILAEEASGLYKWLAENKYAYSGDESALQHYIAKKWVFTVMKIDPAQMKKNADGSYLGEVTPTRFTFASDACVYPLKITQISVKDKTDALFYVQAPEQMDLEKDFSWKWSYRVMSLTFLVGCGAGSEEQRELQERNAWVAAKRAKDPGYETTKLEWAKKLTEAELSVLEDPLAHYSQMGGGTVQPGGRAVSLEEFLKQVWDEYEKQAGDGDHTYAKQQLKQLEATYSPSKGMIVRTETPSRFIGSTWVWYPNREAPAEEVKGLSRLKGHLQKGQWLTKFRKILRKDEMNEDLLLVPVPAGKEDEYVRIMPTSPP
ncbi:MAG: DUF2330 domain-containing protein [Candidatus Brocadiae bacterium]|nr:DUF2330 domain-containing protein [Candidatus Brocadiia bacterium]